MTRMSHDVVRSVLAGAASGGRTFTGLALLTPGTPRVTGLVGVAAAGELVADKLPFAPSRLQPPGLVGRVVAGAACGGLLARREPATQPVGPARATAFDPTAMAEGPDDRRNRTIACVLAGAATALVASWAGTRWRSAASSWFGTDWIGAVAEDVIVVGLAVTAARR